MSEDKREAFVFDVPGSRKWRIVRITAAGSFNYILEYLRKDNMGASQWANAVGENAWGFIWHAASSASPFDPKKDYWLDGNELHDA